MNEKKIIYLNKKIGYLAAVLITGLFGGLNASSVYGAAETQTVNFTSEFSSNSTPLCGGPDVSFAGTARFVFHETIDENGQVHQQTHMNYFKGKGTDLSGDRYVIAETDHFTTQDNDKTNVFHTVINGKLVHNGKETDTGVIINLLTVMDENGDFKTTIDTIDVRCNEGKG